MKVLHLLDEPYDSGISHYALKVAAGLSRRGHSSRVWGLRGRWPLAEAARLGLETAAFSRPLLGLLPLRRALRAGEADLVVAHTGSAHTMAAAAAAGTRVPLLRTRGDARLMRRRPGLRLLWRRTAGFVAANRRILEQFRKLYGALPLLSGVIYEGREDPGAPRPAPEPLRVGIVGRLDPVKGHRYFILAASRLRRRFPALRFQIVGRQENVKAEDLRRQARELGLDGSLELSGHVPDALEAMRGCHVGVIASTGSEAVSRAAVEWMSLGRPLVATSVGCLPEYVEEGASGFLVPPRDPSALSSRIERLLQEPLLRERMGREGRRRYERLFTLERFLDETEQFYGQTIHSVSSR